MSNKTKFKKIKFININKSKKHNYTNINNKNSTSSTPYIPSSQSYKTYLTHNNYLRPYMIKVYNNIKKIQVYKKQSLTNNNQQQKNNTHKHINNNNPYTKNISRYTQLVKTYKVDKLYIGKPIINDNAYKYYKTKNKANAFGKGNSILAKIGNNKYVFIGECVYEFTTTEPILEYYSPIGRNDVPYPVAISKNYVYYLISAGKYGYLPKDEYFIDFPEKYSWSDYSYARLWGKGFTKSLTKVTNKLNNLEIIDDTVID